MVLLQLISISYIICWALDVKNLQGALAALKKHTCEKHGGEAFSLENMVKLWSSWMVRRLLVRCSGCRDIGCGCPSLQLSQLRL